MTEEKNKNDIKNQQDEPGTFCVQAKPEKLDEKISQLQSDSSEKFR